MTTQLVDSLALVAETHGDIAPAVFERFYAHSPAAAAIMDHMDDYMCGRMMDQVLLLLMEPGEDELEMYVSFEVGNHEGYGVQLPMYRALFDAVHETVRGALDGQWTDGFEQAWAQKIERLFKAIESASSKAH